MAVLAASLYQAAEDGPVTENVVEYVELRDKRLEVSSVLEKLDREDKTLQKAKTNQEKFRRPWGASCTSHLRTKPR